MLAITVLIWLNILPNFNRSLLIIDLYLKYLGIGVFYVGEYENLIDRCPVSNLKKDIKRWKHYEKRCIGIIRELYFKN